MPQGGVKGASRGRPRVAIVGAGALASGVAAALHAAGYTITEVVARDLPASRQRARALARRVAARAVTLQDARLDVGLVWLCVPDAAIAGCARLLAANVDWSGKVVLHASGALGADQLAPLRRRGAAAGSLHPMMTFARARAPALRGVLFAFEGDKAAAQLARRLTQDLGGEFFTLRPEDKPLYHAWGSFSSPMLVATLALGELAARRAGVPARSIRRVIAPIVERTITNYLKAGPEAALTGPLVRGDVVTIRKHLQELRRIPQARAAYVALTSAAIKLLPVKKRKEFQQLLTRAAAK